MFKMRPIDKVIDAIALQVPEGECAGFLGRLERIKKDVVYRSPEMMLVSWQELMHACEDWLGPANTDWKRKIADIMTTKIDYLEILKQGDEQCLSK